MTKAELQIFRALSGYPTARLQFHDGRKLHLHSTVSPERESEYFEHQEIWGEVVVLLGTGLGYHLGRCWEELSDGREVVLVDVYQECLEQSIAKLRPGAAGVGLRTDEAAKLAGVVEQSRGKTVQVIRHPPSYAAHPQEYDGIEQALLAQDATDKEAGIGSVLVLCGRFFFQDELCLAVEETGRRCVRFDYESGSPDTLSDRFQKALAVERPELVVSIGFKGCDPEGELLSLCARYGLPVAVWFVDDPRPNCLAFREQIGSNIYAFCWERAYLSWLENWEFGSVAYLPLAACSSVFDREHGGGVELGISFTGSPMGEEFLDGIRRRFLWDPLLEPEVESRARRLLSGQLDALSVSSGDLPYTDEKNRCWFGSLVIHTASGIKRRELCRGVVGEGLVLVGDPQGWQKALGPQARCLPHVDYRSQLGSIYKHSAINLNITSCQMPMAVNQRLFDAPLAGGFLLNDPQADATTLFTEGEEIVVYRSPQELSDLARFYLSRPALRAKVVSAAQRRIRSEHCVRHRLERMIQCIGEG